MERKGGVKYAIVGLSGAFASLIKLFLKAVKTASEFRFFKREEDAVRWLKERE